MDTGFNYPDDTRLLLYSVTSLNNDECYSLGENRHQFAYDFVSELSMVVVDLWRGRGGYESYLSPQCR